MNNRGRKLTCFYGGTEGFISETIRESEITRITPSNCDFFFSPKFFLFKKILNKFGNMEKWVSEQLT